MSKKQILFRPKFFAGLIFDSTIFGLDKIQLLSEIEQDLQNTNLYKTIQIIEICYNLEKMANALPEDIFTPFYISNADFYIISII
jgi:hypothetical protein